jgi:hypothetical protein
MLFVGLAALAAWSIDVHLGGRDVRIQSPQNPHSPGQNPQQFWLKPRGLGTYEKQIVRDVGFAWKKQPVDRDVYNMM